MVGKYLIALLLLTGCAGTNVNRVATGEIAGPGEVLDSKADGIRYYEIAPFLLVYTDGRGGLTSQLLFLPDLTRKRVIDPFAVLATNNTTLTFVNGVLTQGKTVVDETVVPKAIVGALEKAAIAAVNAFLNDVGTPPTTQVPPPQLFKIVLENGGGRLVGGKSVGSNGEIRMIDITVTDPGGESKTTEKSSPEKKP
ncbi:hypothetical protein C8R32_109104 [Nitrosospira sp. Nsp5]|uniref:Lipoprotein n=1 Tax=Nitrosospira multiformis TaxID=1231 RepID=A0ABY0TII2_9PROT|nr:MULTISPECIES: hypothetical protein [Nitrosospira]PTR06818.1 hypothetical protein C8R32_109104 [Nitrosospira sp. Nsp5]SDQ88960.1 hypothetical protein SAMN05216402_2701 [Nitrosospira multiformis]